MHIIVFSFLQESLSSRYCKGITTKAAFLSAIMLVLLSAVYQMTGSTLQSFADTKKETIQRLLDTEALYSAKGPIAGKMHDQYAGIVAFSLNREYAGGIAERQWEDKAALEKALQRSVATQILWRGEIPATFRMIKSIEIERQVQYGGELFSVFLLKNHK